MQVGVSLWVQHWLLLVMVHRTEDSPSISCLTGKNVFVTQKHFLGVSTVVQPLSTSVQPNRNQIVQVDFVDPWDIVARRVFVWLLVCHVVQRVGTCVLHLFACAR